jgi:beta-alanine degradation protein BauB
VNNEEVNEVRRALAAVLPALALIAPATAQDASKIQSRAYRVVLENDKLRVLEFNSKPGMGVCGSGKHSHPAHLTVALTAAKVRVKLDDGRTVVAENSPGDVFWSEAETHETENISGRNVRALIVELKDCAKV